MVTAHPRQQRCETGLVFATYRSSSEEKSEGFPPQLSAGEGGSSLLQRSRAGSRACTEAVGGLCAHGAAALMQTLTLFWPGKGRAEALRLPVWDARNKDPKDSEIRCLNRGLAGAAINSPAKHHAANLSRAGCPHGQELPGALRGRPALLLCSTAPGSLLAPARQA